VWVGIVLIAALWMWFEGAHAAPMMWENGPSLALPRAFFYKSSHCFGGASAHAARLSFRHLELLILRAWLHYFVLCGVARERAITYWLLSSLMHSFRLIKIKQPRRGRVSAVCMCVGRRDHLFASRILHTKCRDSEWDESVCGLRALTFAATRAGML
jgi:hypothetical protein